MGRGLTAFSCSVIPGMAWDFWDPRASSDKEPEGWGRSVFFQEGYVAYCGTQDDLGALHRH